MINSKNFNLNAHEIHKMNTIMGIINFFILSLLQLTHKDCLY